MEENILKDITSVVNHKGGVAKTSTVLGLAGGLLRKNKRLKVLVIDMDSQCNLSMLCGWNFNNKELPTVYEALRDQKGIPVYKSERGIYFSPASRMLQQVDVDLFRQMQPYQVLWNCFCNEVDDRTGEGFKNVVNFDYVIIDCPPALSGTTYNAMAVSSRILIPVQLEPLSINGLAPILVEQERVDQSLRQRQGQEIVIVPVMVDGQTRISRSYHNYLEETYGQYLSDCQIRKDVKMKESQMKLQDIFSYAPYSRVASDYERLVKELYSLK